MAGTDPSNPSPYQSFVPVPDPTKLTTEAVDRLEKTLRSYFDIHIEALDKDILRIQKELDTRPQVINAELSHLRELMIEKFKGVDQQFAGRDTALAAALLAQKTSVEEQNKANSASAGKSEAGFTKQIDAVSATISAVSQNGDDKIDSVKLLIAAGDKTNADNLNDVKATLAALNGNRQGGSNTWSSIGGIIGSIAAIIAILIGLGALFAANSASRTVIDVPAVTKPQ